MLKSGGGGVSWGRSPTVNPTVTVGVALVRVPPKQAGSMEALPLERIEGPRPSSLSLCLSLAKVSAPKWDLGGGRMLTAAFAEYLLRATL